MLSKLLSKFPPGKICEMFLADKAKKAPKRANFRRPNDEMPLDAAGPAEGIFCERISIAKKPFPFCLSGKKGELSGVSAELRFIAIGISDGR